MQSTCQAAVTCIGIAWQQGQPIHCSSVECACWQCAWHFLAAHEHQDKSAIHHCPGAGQLQMSICCCCCYGRCCCCCYGRCCCCGCCCCVCDKHSLVCRLMSESMMPMTANLSTSEGIADKQASGRQSSEVHALQRNSYCKAQLMHGQYLHKTLSATLFVHDRASTSDH